MTKEEKAEQGRFVRRLEGMISMAGGAVGSRVHWREGVKSALAAYHMLVKGEK